jgi:hypothetical protein
VNKIFIIILLVQALAGVSYFGWNEYQDAKEFEFMLEEAYEEMEQAESEARTAAIAWRDEAFDLDEQHRATRKELEKYVQGNPNLDLYLMSSVPDDVVVWMHHFYTDQIINEYHPSGYIPATSEEAVSLGMSQRGVLMTIFETVEALKECNSRVAQEIERQSK